MAINGRGNVYEPSESDLDFVYEMTSQGSSQEAIYKALGISHPTFHKNLEKFAKSIKAGREVYDAHIDRQVPIVESALIKKCTGYEYDEVKTVTYKSKPKKGEMDTEEPGEVIETTVTRKHVQPDAASIFYFLGNRAPGRWVNKYDNRYDDPNKEDVEASIEISERPTASVPVVGSENAAS